MGSGDQPTATKTVLVTKTSFGTINLYDNCEPFENVIERVEAFFLVNRAASDNNKVYPLSLHAQLFWI